MSSAVIAEHAAEPVPAEPHLAEPYMARTLAVLGLSVEYVRAEGDTLYHRDEQGAERAVLDLVGAFGATILGHNDPDVVAHAKAILDARLPVYAQFSLHPYADTVARKLNGILTRELGEAEPYFAVFANSGAEANEIALKHAELDRVTRLAELCGALHENRENARAALVEGTAVLADDAFAVLGVDVHDADHLLKAAELANAESLSAPPVLLALEGSFHGKLVGSVQLTHNPSFRLPFSSLAAQCRFVPADRPEALARIVEGERRTVFDFTLDAGVVGVVERDMPVFCAFVLEPIQGEAGINVLTEETARHIQQVCAAVGCPIVIDEVQSGMGRSGSFFASAGIGLRGDYYTLAKSLGGGVAKAAVTLVRASCYRQDFDLIHSSTYAKDGFSTRIAEKVIDLLETDGGAAYRLATARGEALMTELRAVQAEFPDVVKEVRGKGLMVGLEFHDQSVAAAPALREKADMFGYFAAGYLMRAHAIRIFPTASAVHTLRFEPSVRLTDAAIARTGAALRDLCGVLRAQDAARLLGL
ncbi:acetylornithine/succinyldiaminopimelate/putrescine aminotransferase [Actinocorallia herbida]|uniref:Acetylornithine/succinyldiaminopimelate/putresci ne aminotransferase n=1 Tax=Actinocorallia herbida TaxID=58109 RepID=A0A3N1CZX7_9ACTN|nr:aminotransferase class III-fold pyridoxal phosphate-dependent enzyme [Actinocorallia herbida]ROO86837.1 acetylornithine/succinyldiaminopimelate/putrescine aminotransferase [Actinocorallia herbida]